jgi:hypothetical protein
MASAISFVLLMIIGLLIKMGAAFAKGARRKIYAHGFKIIANPLDSFAKAGNAGWLKVKEFLTRQHTADLDFCLQPKCLRVTGKVITFSDEIGSILDHFIACFISGVSKSTFVW